MKNERKKRKENENKMASLQEETASADEQKKSTQFEKQVSKIFQFYFKSARFCLVDPSCFDASRDIPFCFFWTRHKLTLHSSINHTRLRKSQLWTIPHLNTTIVMPKLRLSEHSPSWVILSRLRHTSILRRELATSQRHVTKVLLKMVTRCRTLIIKVLDRLLKPLRRGLVWGRKVRHLGSLKVCDREF